MSMKGGWTRLLFYTHILVMSPGFCDRICGRLCPSMGSVPGWNADCYIQREDCGFIEDTGQPPSAPRNLRILNYVNHTSDTTALLAMNITWELPENASGLTGFVVRVMKTSYPVGYQDCRKITFDNAASIPDTSKVIFSASCWNDIDVDSKYQIKVQSLNSGQSLSREHHTSECQDVPEVSGCLIGCQESSCSIDPPDDWIPRNKPTAIVYNDQVTVSFDVYPGDFWLTYRINLYNLDLHRTEIFHKVNTNGSSGRFDYTFYSVEPGSYDARVQIDTGDPYQVRSDPFQVLPVVEATPPPPPPTTTPIHVATSIPQEQDPGSSPMPQSGIKEILTYTGVGIGIVAAVGILFGLIMWKRRKQKLMGGSSGTGGGSSTSTPNSSPPCSDTFPVVNNMAYNNVVKLPDEGQYGKTRNDLGQSSWSEDEQSKMQAYRDPYQEGSIYTDYSEYCHTVKGIDRNILDDEPESCVSRSGIVM